MNAADLLEKQHREVKSLFKKLEKTETAAAQDDRFEAKMTVLSELIEHHVEEEESEMFKLAEKLGKDELTDLGAQMAGRADELKGVGRRVA